MEVLDNALCDKNVELKMPHQLCTSRWSWWDADESYHKGKGPVTYVPYPVPKQHVMLSSLISGLITNLIKLEWILSRYTESRWSTRVLLRQLLTNMVLKSQPLLFVPVFVAGNRCHQRRLKLTSGRELERHRAQGSGQRAAGNHRSQYQNRSWTQHEEKKNG